MMPFTPYSAIAISLIIVSVVIAMTSLVLSGINLASEGRPFPHVGYVSVMALTISAVGISVIDFQVRRYKH